MEHDPAEITKRMQNFGIAPMHPPGSTPPGFVPPIHSRLHGRDDDLGDIPSKINGFRNTFLKTASDLTRVQEHGPSLPGQKPYVRGDVLESLRAKNQMLEKENMDLKKQLDQIRKKINNSNL